jgi:hypothetical protein
MEEHVNLSDINYLKNIFISISKIIYKCSPLIKIISQQVVWNANPLAMWDKKSKTLNFIGKWRICHTHEIRIGVFGSDFVI